MADDHDQDLLLARVLQEQERAFHAMSSIAPANKSASREARQPPSEGLSDEELARQLQEQEDEELYDQEGSQDLGFEFDADVDYDRLSYEEFNALGDVVGAVSKGLSNDVLLQLPGMPASQHMQQQCRCSLDQQQDTQRHSNAVATATPACKAKDCTCAAASSMCVVCQCEFEGSEMLKLLPSCGHVYHEECITQWLSSNKSCPICHKEVACSKDSSTTTKAT